MRAALTILICLLLESYGALQWDEKVVTLTAIPGETSSEARFSFSNKSGSLIEIQKINSTCSCTEASASPSVIAPDESGYITVGFKFENRIGKQRKRIEVHTSDGKRHNLYLNIDIPRTYELSSRRLAWSDGNLEAQSIKLTNVSQTPLDIESIGSSNPIFSVSLTEVREGFEYHIVVSPTKVATSGRSIITITAQSVGGQKPQVYKVYVQNR